MRVFVILLMSVALAFSSCGLLNALVGTSGAPTHANQPEVKQKAQDADRAVWDWLYALFFGAGYGAKKAKDGYVRRRAATKAKATP